MSGQILLVLRIALALSLYAFLGWALLTLWRDLKRQSEMLAARQAPPISLLRPAIDGSFEPFRFVAAEILVGRDPVCDLCLDDKTVSAEHARLAYHHNQWWVEDLRSRNGTYLNQEVISSPIVVTTGDELRFGQVVLVVQVGDKQPAQARPTEVSV